MIFLSSPSATYRIDPFGFKMGDTISVTGDLKVAACVLPFRTKVVQSLLFQVTSEAELYRESC